MRTIGKNCELSIKLARYCIDILSQIWYIEYNKEER